jgi:hypothetical protein
MLGFVFLLCTAACGGETQRLCGKWKLTRQRCRLAVQLWPTKTSLHRHGANDHDYGTANCSFHDYDYGTEGVDAKCIHQLVYSVSISFPQTNVKYQANNFLCEDYQVNV